MRRKTLKKHLNNDGIAWSSFVFGRAIPSWNSPEKQRVSSIKQSYIHMTENSDADYVVFGEGSSPRLENFQQAFNSASCFPHLLSGIRGLIRRQSVKAASHLLALLGFLLFPIIWSVPQVLITTEHGTMFPENAGYVVWVSSALGPFWGFQLVWMKWLSRVIETALFPVLFLDYLKSAIPQLEGGFTRAIAILVLTVAPAYLGL